MKEKNMVDAVQKLLKIDDRTREQENLLEELFNELDLKIEDNGLLSLKEPKKSRRKYVGPSEPRISLFERVIAEDLKRVQILKRDLRMLDDWLEQLEHITRRPMPVKRGHSSSWKELGEPFRQRTRNRICDMEKARTKLIKHHYIDYDQSLKDVLVPETFLKGTSRERSTTRRTEGTDVINKVSEVKTEKEQPRILNIKADSGRSNITIKKENDTDVLHDVPASTSGTNDSEFTESKIKTESNENTDVTNDVSDGETEREQPVNSLIKEDPDESRTTVETENDASVSHGARSSTEGTDDSVFKESKIETQSNEKVDVSNKVSDENPEIEKPGRISGWWKHRRGKKKE